MNSFQDLLSEKIDSKRIRYDVAKTLQKEIDFEDSARMMTQVKRGVKKLLDKYVDNRYIEKNVSVKMGNETRGSAGVEISKSTLEVKSVIFNIVLDTNNVGRPSFYADLLETIVHELVHVVQNARSGYENVRSEVRHDNKHGEQESNIRGSTELYKKYLSDRKEIEAYAVNVSQELDHKDVNKEKFLSYMSDYRKLRSLVAHKWSPTLTRYYYYFHESDDPKDQKVWQLFVKKVLNHL